MTLIRQNLLSLAAVLALFLLSAILYPDLPERVVVGFDYEGQVTTLRPRLLAVFQLPGLYLLVLVLIHGLMRVMPEKFAMPNSKRAMDIILGGIGVMFCFLHFGLLGNNGEFDFFVTWFSFGMGCSLIIIGNVFGKTERNFLFGVRTPWSIASSQNWKATHRLMGKLMVVVGIVLTVSSLLYANLLLTIVLTVSTLVIPVVYSLIYYLRFEQGLSNAEE